MKTIRKPFVTSLTLCIVAAAAAQEPKVEEVLADYGRSLIEKSGWPIEFEDVLVYTSRTGYQLRFRFDPSSDGGTAYASLSRRERIAHWTATVCTRELQDIVDRYESGPIVSRIVDVTGGPVTTADCSPDRKTPAQSRY